MHNHQQNALFEKCLHHRWTTENFCIFKQSGLELGEEQTDGLWVKRSRKLSKL